MSIYGERIRQARELSGMTQEQLADVVGISRSLLAHIETDRVTPTLDAVRAIAEKTEVQETFFEIPPTINMQSPPVFRARASLSAIERDKAYQYANLCVEQFQRMAPRLNLPDLQLPKGNLNAVSSARLMRVIAGIEPTRPVPHLVGTLEQNGVVVVAMPFPLQKLDAFSCWSSNNDRPIIVTSAEKPGDRLRFSVAHELGHIILHKDKIQHDHILEDEADAFAAEFLLPETAMRLTMTPAFGLTQAARLKLRWRVSMQMLVRRAHDLGIITERRYHYLFEQMGKMGWKTREPENLDVPVERPRAFRKMVELLYGATDQCGELASAAHISYRLAERMLDVYSLGAQASLVDTEEYISSKHKLSSN